MGNPAAALVRGAARGGRGPAAGDVHRGATSQDVVDSAAMLIARRALEPLLDDLRGAADAAARLASEHRETVMAGRTLLQQAVPVTFGLKAAGWLVGLDEAAQRLDAVRPRAWPRSSAAPRAPSPRWARRARRAARFARELELAEPVMPWHTTRTRTRSWRGAGAASGALAKAAGDVVLLAQTEVGEVREGGGGGSSAMPHKHNPVAAISALAGARQAPGLVANLLGAMDHEHERAAGAWHAEWAPLRELLRSTGSAAAWLRECLEQLEVDPERMRANLDDALLAERVAGAIGGSGASDARPRARSAPGSRWPRSRARISPRPRPRASSIPRPTSAPRISSSTAR